VVSDLTKEVNNVKALMDKNGFETYSEKISINKKAGWIMAKAVTASDKSCYSCHTNVKEGQPIGHVIAAVWSK
jgi:hypothetical protein